MTNSPLVASKKASVFYATNLQNLGNWGEILAQLDTARHRASSLLLAGPSHARHVGFPYAPGCSTLPPPGAAKHPFEIRLSGTRSRLTAASFHSPPLPEATEAGDSPGQRITARSSGVARRLAGLCCGRSCSDPRYCSHLWPYVFRAGPNGFPYCPQTTARHCRLPAGSESIAAPRPVGKPHSTPRWDAMVERRGWAMPSPPHSNTSGRRRNWRRSEALEKITWGGQAGKNSAT